MLFHLKPLLVYNDHPYHHNRGIHSICLATCPSLYTSFPSYFNLLHGSRSGWVSGCMKHISTVAKIFEESLLPCIRMDTGTSSHSHGCDYVKCKYTYILHAVYSYFTLDLMLLHVCVL